MDFALKITILFLLISVFITLSVSDDFKDKCEAKNGVFVFTRGGELCLKKDIILDLN